MPEQEYGRLVQTTMLMLCVVLVAGCGSSTPPEPEPGPGPGPGPGPTPGPGPAPQTQCAGTPPSPDYECVQDCGEPVAREGDPVPGWSWLSPADAESRRMHGCPICLPADTRIATPAGDVVVSELREGDAIWSRDCAGERIAARVRVVRSVPVPAGHRVVRVMLGDGRVASASPRHPLAGGRVIASLERGDSLDGSEVEHVELVPYAGGRTWDVLPSGESGEYWADGVVMGSTLGGGCVTD